MAEESREDRPGGEPDEVRSTLAVLRDLLTRSVMLPADLVREVLDDAVRRGRMTRDDADELVARLTALGRAQAEEALSRLEPVLGPGRAAATGARDRARSAVRRATGTERLLREVDRARRGAGLGSSFPIPGYDDLTAAQVVERLGDLGPAELREVRDHERRNANRKSVLAAVERQLRG